MPHIDVIDSTWIPAAPASVAAVVGDPANWSVWWPGLALRVQQRRGEQGVRWAVPPVTDGPAAGYSGTAEVWLQAMHGGVVAHFFLRLDPVGARRPGRAHRIERYYRVRTKEAFWALADAADPQRRARAVDPLWRGAEPAGAPGTGGAPAAAALGAAHPGPAHGHG